MKHSGSRAELALAVAQRLREAALATSRADHAVACQQLRRLEAESRRHEHALVRAESECRDLAAGGRRLEPQEMMTRLSWMSACQQELALANDRVAGGRDDVARALDELRDALTRKSALDRLQQRYRREADSLTQRRVIGELDSLGVMRMTGNMVLARE